MCIRDRMYYGVQKNLKLTRTVYRGNQEQRVSETLTIDVKPGWKKGTKITFPEKGDEVGSQNDTVHLRLLTRSVMFPPTFVRSFIQYKYYA